MYKSSLKFRRKKIMTENKNFLENVNKLPNKAKECVYLFIENFDCITEMCNNTVMTDAEIEQKIKAALESKDYMLLMILYYYKAVKESRDL